MALNSSGPISLAGSTAGQSIAIELGQSATGQISLNDTNVRTLAGVSSGAIIMPTNFYGKSTNFTFSPTISTTVTDYDLRAAAVTAGWNQTVPLIATVTISATGVIGSSSTSTAALIWTGSYPTGSTLAVINNGYIVGRGGAGGNGGTGGSGDAGGSGGPAMQGNYAISFTNNTTIGGGGSGGTGGTGAFNFGSPAGGGGGGGGGAGFGTGGSGGGGFSGGTSGGNGGTGTATAGGTGGFGGTPSGGAGNNGGSLGNGNCTVSGTNAYITWVATGTRLGTLG
jgi:hypothetical protein